MLPFHLKGQNSGWVCMPHNIRGAGGDHARRPFHRQKWPKNGKN